MMDNKKIKRKLLLKKYILETLQITFGCMLMAIGIAQFLLPNKLSSGGFSGIATIPYYLLGWPVGFTILILNIPCFILAYIRVGKEFLVKTLIGTTVLSFMIDFFSKYAALTQDRILACIYGGVFIGIGTAIILRNNASTGGSDVVSIIIKSFRPGLSTSNLIIMFDAIVITLNVLVFKQLEIGLYSAITIFIMGKMIDIVFEGIGFSKMIFIISEQYEKIAKEIGKETRHTAQLQEEIAKHRPGDKVSVTFYRNNEKKTVNVTLRNSKGNTTVTRSGSVVELGCAFKTVAPETLRQLELSNGVQVTGLKEGKFKNAGIKDGFIILDINNTRITSVDDVEKIYKAIMTDQRGYDKVMFITGVYPTGRKVYYAVDLE